MSSLSPSELAITRTGARVFDPRGSSIYSVNPCPPVKYFSGIKADFTDDEGNKYWLALAHEKLAGWVTESSLMSLIESTFAAESDSLFFVRQNKVGMQKLNCQVFTLPSSSSEIQLVGAKQDHRGTWTGVVQSVGQHGSSSSYSSRRVLWMVVRNLLREVSE